MQRRGRPREYVVMIELEAQARTLGLLEERS